MKIHIAKLLDRHAVGGPTLRVQTDRGLCLDVRVRPQDTEHAGSLRGGALVRYARSGSRWVYVTQDDAYASQER